MICCKTIKLSFSKGGNLSDKQGKEQDVVTVLELCEWLKISRKYAYQFIREHRIRYMKIGHKFYISKRDVEEILKMER